MELTGYSTDFVVGSGFTDTARAFIAAQASRWPGLHLDGEPASADSATLWSPKEDPDDEYPEILTFSSGPAMEAFWEDHGYTLNSDGEGPFSLFFLPRRGPIRARLSEDADTDPVMQGATVLLSDFHLVSLVTPDDPVTDPFSASVRDDFLHCFAATLRSFW